MGRLFKQGLSIVEQNRVLSRFQFDQRFYLNTNDHRFYLNTMFCREQFQSTD